MTEPNATARRNVDEILADLGELAERQAELEKRFEFVCDNLKAMAERLSGDISRTRQRVFIEQAAVRLYPAVYARLSGGTDAATMAKSTVSKATALWKVLDANLNPEKDETDG